ncbi:hypothetical protein ACDF64_07430 [Agromyces sp. MMS24-JH15]|uniref:PDC sensor domain-containing protein n=1 Tax=Agromyces sp. MMS24-JH15 TaxID=3243765 RepID=UPI0037486F87
MSRTPAEAAGAVGDAFRDVFDQLTAWRTEIEALLRRGGGLPRPGGGGDAGPADLRTPELRPADLDHAIAELVLPRLAAEDPDLVGAGFIADGEVVRGREVHFAWWLAPLDDNPVLGSTDVPTRLDLSTRGYTEYLRDFRALEWYRIPATTRTAHVTGPYVDHLCTCDYILTVTMPVQLADGEPMVGVVGADVAVRRLERDLLGVFLDVDEPLALVNEQGRVMLSTDPAVEVGRLVDGIAGRTDASGASADRLVPCPDTPFAVLVRPADLLP